MCPQSDGRQEVSWGRPGCLHQGSRQICGGCSPAAGGGQPARSEGSDKACGLHGLPALSRMFSCLMNARTM